MHLRKVCVYQKEAWSVKTTEAHVMNSWLGRKTPKC